MRIEDVFAPDVIGTRTHLARLAELRALGDVVELAPPTSGRRTFVVVSHAAMMDAAKSRALSSRFGTGVFDVAESDRNDGVPFRAINVSDGDVHALLRSLLQPMTHASTNTAPVAFSSTIDPATTFGPFVLARLGPRFGFDADVVAHGFALAHRAAFAAHDERQSRTVLADVDRALVELSRAQLEAKSAPPQTIASTLRAAIASHAVTLDDAAWLARFAFLTAFVTTELACMHLVALLADRDRDELSASAEARARFVDDSLRIQSPVARFGRVAIDDVTLANVTIPKGARVILSFAAANHDPNGDRSKSFAFGIGPHACLGAGVAIEMLRDVVDALVRWPPYRVIESETLRSMVNRASRRLRLDVEPSPS